MRLALGIGLILLLTACGGDSEEAGIDILAAQDTESDALAETIEDSTDTPSPTPDMEDSSEEDPCLTTNCSARINAVYIAQNHVLRPSNPYFSLVSQRPALLKVVVTTSDSKDSKAPPVTVALTRKGKTEELTLAGPTTLVTEIDLEPGKVEHKYANSFTVMIPKKWVQPGLLLTVTAGTSKKEFTELKIGAPNRLYMTMFDVHFWGYKDAHTSDYSTGWESELEAKLPISELVVERIPHISFEQVVTIPLEDSESAATLASSVEDYKEQTGVDYDGEQAVALLWKDALQKAGGQKKLSLYFVNIINSKAKTLGGQGGDFSGVGSILDGVFFHELGHALSLPHWGEVEDYPYQGEMYGISVGGDPENNQHVGPTWGFDQREGSTIAGYSFPYFISPVVQPHAVQEAVDNELVGTWKRDPMQGGGTGDQEQGFLFRMFSDYSVFKMREWLEGYLLKWNTFYFRYAAWDEESGDYDKLADKDEVNLPIENKVQVYSLLTNISGVTAEANYIYPLIGPYESGLIRKFDPTIKAEREAAAELFCPENGCDLSLRVVQGGVTKHIMLNAPWLPDANPFSTEGFFVRAVNLAVKDGTVSTVELLLTPDAQNDGLPDDPTVLYSYEYHDCNNVLGGAALIDQCGDCSGGDTGKEINAGCCTPGGKITLETWTDMKGKIADIPLIQAPDEKESLTRWNKKWQKKDHIGTRVRALLCVPETDIYQFAIASDDNGELWLSDDEYPINKEMVAWVQHWTPYQVFDDEATQISLDIPLEGGKKYYLESLHQQGGGGVHLTVSWAKVGGELQIIKGSQTVPVKVETLD